LVLNIQNWIGSERKKEKRNNENEMKMKMFYFGLLFKVLKKLKLYKINSHA